MFQSPGLRTALRNSNKFERCLGCSAVNGGNIFTYSKFASLMSIQVVAQQNHRKWLYFTNTWRIFFEYKLIDIISFHPGNSESLSRREPVLIWSYQTQICAHPSRSSSFKLSTCQVDSCLTCMDYNIQVNNRLFYWEACMLRRIRQSTNRYWVL